MAFKTGLKYFRTPRNRLSQECFRMTQKCIHQEGFCERIDHIELMQILKNKHDSIKLNETIIYDVRCPKMDYRGGHIKHAVNIPHYHFNHRLSSIIKQSYHKKVVVFHCMYSQHRGPLCYEWYSSFINQICCRQNDEQTAEIAEKLKSQKVYLLSHGFFKFINEYINDENNKDLIEDFNPYQWKVE
eukprot:607523_1